MEHGPSVTHLVMILALQISIILIVAKLFGALFEKIGQSSVLGELIAGMLIGPYALGAINLPLIGPLFVLNTQSNIPISTELFAFAQIGAVILLFLVGLETDADMFMKYGVKAFWIAMGGVIVPFFLGAAATVWFGFANSWTDNNALFMGAIMTATSVGITARVLSDIKKLETPEGVSILAAAVIDDVLGILTLSLVISIAKTGGSISWGSLAIVGIKAVTFFGIMIALGYFFGQKLATFLLKMEPKTYLALGIAICLLVSSIAEMFGLALIIGAYLCGLLLSMTKIKHELEEKLFWVAGFMVPVFFAAMGMMVNFKAMMAAIGFGVVITIFAIIGKVFGCGIPSLISGFNTLGSTRIGFGMLPRGEVALIVAGVGLAAGIIDQTIFGVSIMMTLVTTLMAPPIILPFFKIPKSGLRSGAKEKSPKKA